MYRHICIWKNKFYKEEKQMTVHSTNNNYIADGRFRCKPGDEELPVVVSNRCCYRVKFQLMHAPDLPQNNFDIALQEDQMATVAASSTAGFWYILKIKIIYGNNIMQKPKLTS